VVVWDPDRLSRADSISTAAVIDHLRTAGVSRLLTQEGWVDFDNDLDRLLFNVKQDMSRAAYSKSLSKNVARSAVRRAREGRWVCGRPPYGYAVGPDGHLTPGDPQRVEAVRWLFRRYAASAVSLGVLAMELNGRGVPPPAGKAWTRMTLRALMLNRAYTGALVWNVKSRAKYHRIAGGDVAAAKKPTRRSKAPRPNDPADYVVVEGAHPALVEPELFEAVGRKLAANYRRGTTPVKRDQENHWILSGLLHCGCGCRMTGVTERRHTGGRTYTYRRYFCTANAKHGPGTCHTNRVSQEDVLREVAAEIRERFTDPGRLVELRAEVEELAREQADAGAADRQRLRDRLAELDRRIDQGAENLLLCPREVRDRAAAKLKDWQEEREQLARELARMDMAAEDGAAFTAQAAAALEALANLEERIATAPPDVAREVLSGLVQKVTLHFDHSTKWGPKRARAVLDYIDIELRPEVSELLGPGRSIRLAT
jgi:hypothetical protein